MPSPLDVDLPDPDATERHVVDVRAADLGGPVARALRRRRRATGGARRAVRAYWLVVRPFSGLLRLLMLRSVRRAAERMAATHPNAPAARRVR